MFGESGPCGFWQLWGASSSCTPTFFEIPKLSLIILDIYRSVMLSGNWVLEYILE